MKLHELQVQSCILDKKQLLQVKGGTEEITSSTNNIITGDTVVF